MQSFFLKLGKSDFVKGLVVAAFGAFIGAVNAAVQTGDPFSLATLEAAGKLALAAALAYLAKQFITNSDGKIGPEQK